MNQNEIYSFPFYNFRPRLHKMLQCSSHSVVMLYLQLPLGGSTTYGSASSHLTDEDYRLKEPLMKTGLDGYCMLIHIRA